MVAPELYSRLAERHGHYCPMSTLGVRLGEMLLRQASIHEGRWQLRYLARTCAVDGIRIVLEGTLPLIVEVEQNGEHCLCCSSADGRDLSLTLSDEALQLAAAYRDLPEAEQAGHLELLRTLPVERMVRLAESTAA